MLAPYSEASKPVSQDCGKVVGRCWRLILKQANLSARIGVKLLGGAGAFILKQAKPISQDWGKVVGRCWRLTLKQANLSARIVVKLLGGSGALF